MKGFVKEVSGFVVNEELNKFEFRFGYKTVIFSLNCKLARAKLKT